MTGAFHAVIWPVPEVLSPIEGLVLVHVYVHPFGIVENMAGDIVFVGQTAIEFIGAKSGIGWTVMIVFIGNPWQELAVGVIE